jgi:hypothetical protein
VSAEPDAWIPFKKRYDDDKYWLRGSTTDTHVQTVPGSKYCYLETQPDTWKAGKPLTNKNNKFACCGKPSFDILKSVLDVKKLEAEPIGLTPNKLPYKYYEEKCAKRGGRLCRKEELCDIIPSPSFIWTNI